MGNTVFDLKTSRNLLIFSEDSIASFICLNCYTPVEVAADTVHTCGYCGARFQIFAEVIRIGISEDIPRLVRR